MNSGRFALEPLTVPGSPERVLVRLQGEIDAANVGQLERDLAWAAGGHPLIVDLSGVEYFDSAAFAMLYRMLALSDLRVVIGLDSILRPAAELISLPMYDSVKDAAGPG